MEKNLSFVSWRHSVVLWLFGCFSSIQLVALCNSRAMGDFSENSDIDIFIITKRGQLWTGRLVVTLIASLLGVRRRNTHGLTKGSPEYIKKTRNKFCLSFFITEDGMDLGSIQLQPNDPYLDRWIATLVPLINKNHTLEHFWKINNQNDSSAMYSLGDIGYSTLERLIQFFWLPKTLKTYKKLGKPWGVVISDTMLKFHDNDQRKVYRDTHAKE